MVIDMEALKVQGLPLGRRDEALETHLALVPPFTRDSVTRSRSLNQSFIFLSLFPSPCPSTHHFD